MSCAKASSSVARAVCSAAKAALRVVLLPATVAVRFVILFASEVKSPVVVVKVSLIVAKLLFGVRYQRSDLLS